MARLRTDALVVCGVLIGYVVGAHAAFSLLAVSDLGAVFFPPAGITLAALTLSPTRRWGMIVAAIVVGEVWVDLQSGLAASWAIVAFAAANALEPVVAALVIGRARRLDLARSRHVVWFLVGGVVVGPLVGGTIGGTTIWATSSRSWLDSVFAWWLGDALGAIVVGSLIIAFFASDGARFNWVESALSCAGAGAAAFAIAYWTSQPAGFVVIIPLMFMSSRNGSRAAAIGSAFITAVTFSSWLGVTEAVSGAAASGNILLTKLQLLTIAAASLVVAAESAELAAASRLAGVRYETAQLLRRALAPDAEVHAPNADAEGISRSADPQLEVGGDWYDVIQVNDDLVGIVIGDVVGHGEDALITMGRLRFAAQAFLMQNRDGGRVLDWLSLFTDRSIGGTYATCLVAYFTPSTGILNYASAGHPPGLIGTADGSWQWLTGARSTPIGVPTTALRESASIQLGHDTTLVVYTDGVVERAGEIIDTGLARMFDAVSQSANRSVSQLVDRLVTASADDASFVRIRLRRGQGVAVDEPSATASFPARPGG